MRHRILALLLVAALSGCGGGGGSSQSPAIPSQAGSTNSGSTDTSNQPWTGPTGTVNASLNVPGASGQSNSRHPEYISAGAKGLKVIITSTSSPAKFTAITAIYTLTVGGNNINIPVPAGIPLDLTFVLYNTTPTGAGAAAIIPTGALPVGWNLTTGVNVASGGVSTLNVNVAGVANNFNNISTTAATDAQTGSVAFTSFSLTGSSMNLATAATQVLGGTAHTAGQNQAVGTSGILTVYDASTVAENVIPGVTAPSTNALVQSVPAVATAAAPTVKASLVETTGSCAAITPTSGHTTIQTFPVTSTATLSAAGTSGTLANAGDGIVINSGLANGGGPGYYSTITVLGQTTNYTYTLSTLAATSTAPATAVTGATWSCANQELQFLSPNASATVSPVEHGVTSGFKATVPTAGCSTIASFVSGATTLTPGGGQFTLSGTNPSITVTELTNPTLAASTNPPTYCVVTLTDPIGTNTYFKVDVPTGASGSL